MSTLIYNLLMSGLVVSLLFILRKQPDRSSLAVVWGSGLALAASLAYLMGDKPFSSLRLFGHGLFVHGVVMLLGSALLLRTAHPRTARVSLAMALLLSVVAVDAYFIEPHWLEVSHIQIRSPKITQPCKIVVIADLQCDSITDYERKVLRRTMAEQPDLILLPGDYIDEWNPERFAETSADLRQLCIEVGLSAPLGVFAVRGDAEDACWPQIFAGLPVTCLTQTETISLPDFQITALPPWRSSLATLEIPPTQPFHIVFGHHPEFALGDVAADLLIAGHTHGGQVQIPGFGPLITLSRVPRAWASGITDLGEGRTLVVSRGIGMERGPAPRMRFFCRPELVVIHLMPNARSQVSTDSPKSPARSD